MSNRLKKSLVYSLYTYLGLFILGCLMKLLGIAESSQTFLGIAILTLWPSIAVFVGAYLYIVKK